MRRLCLIFSLFTAFACAGATPFVDRAVLWKDPDDDPIPLPRKNQVSDVWSRTIQPLADQFERAATLDFGEEARDVNAVDEVPDSSWFINRAKLTPAEMEVGSSPVAAPAPPLVVVSAKRDGATAGFVVQDARGDRYLLKLDPADHPGLATGPDAVGARLYHAAGWNAPSSRIVELDEKVDIVLSAESKMKGEAGQQRLSQGALAELLRRAARTADGRLRAVAVRFVPGTVLGQWSYIGRRGDDPNDRIPHEMRRAVRGMLMIAAWVNNIDTLDTNTLDTYIGEPGRGHVVHYIIDFGTSFGSYAVKPMDAWMGHTAYFHPTQMLASTAGFGIVAQPAWFGPEAEGRRRAALQRWPELGGFSAEGFDPSSWSPLWRNPAFARATARDRYWGAKQMVRVDRPLLRVAVAAGRYRREVAERLEEVLWARRQAILKWAFSRVAPIDGFRVERGRLCFRDLWIDGELGALAGTAYRLSGTLSDGERAARGGDECVGVATRSGVHEVTLAVRRAGEQRFGPAVRLYVADGQRLVGVERGVR